MIEKTIYGTMEWWDVAEQPDDFESLPSEFKEAFDLWKEDGEKNFEKIVLLLEAGHFVAENIYDPLKNFSNLRASRKWKVMNCS